MTNSNQIKTDTTATASASTAADTNPGTKKTRVRVPKSCLICLNAKRACDRQKPSCGRCSHLGFKCKYDNRLNQSKGSSKPSTSSISTNQHKRALASTPAQPAAPLASRLQKSPSVSSAVVQFSQAAASQARAGSTSPSFDSQLELHPLLHNQELPSLRLRLNGGNLDHETLNKRHRANSSFSNVPPSDSGGSSLYVDLGQGAHNFGHEANADHEGREEHGLDRRHSIAHPDLKLMIHQQQIDRLSNGPVSRSGNRPQQDHLSASSNGRSSNASLPSDGFESGAEIRAESGDATLTPTPPAWLPAIDSQISRGHAQPDRDHHRNGRAQLRSPERTPPAEFAAANNLCALATSVSSRPPSHSPNASGSQLGNDDPTADKERDDELKSTGYESDISGQGKHRETVEDDDSDDTDGDTAVIGEDEEDDDDKEQDGVDDDDHDAGKQLEDEKDPSLTRNRNGQPIHYGPGVGAIEVPEDAALEPDMLDSPSKRLVLSSADAINSNLQQAVHSLLYSDVDGFPFVAMWGSGRKFKRQMIDILPDAEQAIPIICSFQQNFAVSNPLLTHPYWLRKMKRFLALPREEKLETPYPWLSVYLMIVAIGESFTQSNADRDLEPEHLAYRVKLRSYLGPVAGDTRAQSRGKAQKRRHSAMEDGLECAGKEEVDHTAFPAPPLGGQERLPEGGGDEPRATEILLSATRQCLRACSFLSSPTLQTIQSQLLIGKYLVYTERSAGLWPMLGCIVRQAQSIGLHVDPQRMRRGNWKPEEEDLWRRLWWAIVHQDLRLSTMYGRPFAVSTFSCGMPGALDGGERPYVVLQCELFEMVRRVVSDPIDQQGLSSGEFDNTISMILNWLERLPARFRIDFDAALKLREDPTSVSTPSTTGMVENVRKVASDERRSFGSLGNPAIQAALLEQIKGRGPKTIAQACYIHLEVHIHLLILHRSRHLLQTKKSASVVGEGGRGGPTPSDSSVVGGNATSPASRQSFSTESFSNKSLELCGRSSSITILAFNLLQTLFGSRRASIMWEEIWAVFQAGVATAQIVVDCPHTRLAAYAMEDLSTLRRLAAWYPNRWKCLTPVRQALTMLEKVALEALEKRLDCLGQASTQYGLKLPGFGNSAEDTISFTNAVINPLFGTQFSNFSHVGAGGGSFSVFDAASGAGGDGFQTPYWSFMDQIGSMPGFHQQDHLDSTIQTNLSHLSSISRSNSNYQAATSSSSSGFPSHDAAVNVPGASSSAPDRGGGVSVSQDPQARMGGPVETDILDYCSQIFTLNG
ncbi:hypothetical protein IE53DRAFT_390977 [Violaceomyces palustris]|uniref:Uncharacterized protein n=1 Tax=Violaceomyces palustris TaxID=1673888 RepID=A0ACD0NM62_9BASI|nr:hypothetical protein IE53DRAFT_390977 [Violaceomyces palustris]